MPQGGNAMVATQSLVDAYSLLHREHPGEEICMAIALALTYGNIDASAVEVPVRQLQRPQ